jgi:hypothetical protein
MLACAFDQERLSIKNLFGETHFPPEPRIIQYNWCYERRSGTLDMMAMGFGARASVLQSGESEPIVSRFPPFDPVREAGA